MKLGIWLKRASRKGILGSQAVEVPQSCFIPIMSPRITRTVEEGKEVWLPSTRDFLESKSADKSRDLVKEPGVKEKGILDSQAVEVPPFLFHPSPHLQSLWKHCMKESLRHPNGNRENPIQKEVS